MDFAGSRVSAGATITPAHLGLGEGNVPSRSLGTRPKLRPFVDAPVRLTSDQLRTPSPDRWWPLARLAALVCLALIPTSVRAADRVVSADMRQVKGPLNTMFKTCVGAGRAAEGLRADWQRQLTYVHEQCGFTYLRMHGLLGDDMGVYREDKNGRPEYNWQYIDEVYDFLLRIHMKPFVELGFCPGALASGTKTIFWWRGNVTKPKDPRKWEGLIRALVTHWKERYGEAEVRTWYFEVWNEPNLDGFFAGTQQDYFELYATTARAIKSVSAAYRVGGPATAGCAWIPEFIAYCDSQPRPGRFRLQSRLCRRCRSSR